MRRHLRSTTRCSSSSYIRSISQWKKTTTRYLKNDVSQSSVSRHRHQLTTSCFSTHSQSSLSDKNSGNPPPNTLSIHGLPSREDQVARLKSGEVFDVLVVGAGATGAGTALDAVSRGLSVACVERGDFASETSSRSTKLYTLPFQLL